MPKNQELIATTILSAFKHVDPPPVLNVVASLHLTQLFLFTTTNNHMIWERGKILIHIVNEQCYLGCEYVYPSVPLFHDCSWLIDISKICVYTFLGRT